MPLVAAFTDAETFIMVAQYVVFITITVIFSLLSLDAADVKKAVYCAVAWVMWWLTAMMHLGLAPADTVTQVAPAVLFFGLGLLWLVLTFKSVIELQGVAFRKRYSVETL
jgi:hypothetical protein